MKIAISSTIFFNQKFGGISRYFINLSNEFDKSKLEYKIIAPISKNILLKKKKNNKISLYFSRFPINSIIKKINNLIFTYLCKKYNPDIIHETYYNSDNLKYCKDTIKVLTVYDLIHEKFPKYYQKSQILKKKKILNLFDHFICISKNTQKDFIKYYKIKKKNTSVIYLSGHHIKKIKSSDKNINLKNKLFFLFVGSRDNYKNFHLIVNIFNQFSLLDNYKLVCFGGGNFSEDEKKTFKNLDQFLNYQGDDSLLKYLYENAFAHIIPSFYEGFGITVLEAMELGCPVISSNTGSLKEVGGSACMYFNPKSSNDLIKKINLLIENKKIYQSLIDKGYRHCARHTWKKCAQKTYQLYKKLNLGY
jgi:glycosyltransferase involved in cell wall biosynthesis